MAKTLENNNLTNSLRELSEIVKWFEDQEDVDVEVGLDKVKRGAVLVKACRERLKSIENEFKEIQSDIEQEDTTDTTNTDSPIDEDPVATLF